MTKSKIETIEVQGTPVEFTKAARKKAVALMRKYRTLSNDRDALQATIATKVSTYDKKMADTESKLLEIGKVFTKFFDDKNRLDLEEGYLLKSKETIIKQEEHFDIDSFMTDHPEKVSIALKVKPIKDAFLNEEERVDMSACGLTLDTEEKIVLKLHKKATT